MTRSDQMKRFQDVVSAYGANSARWPLADRSALEAFATSDAEAAVLLAHEASFDQVLACGTAEGSSRAAQSAKDRLLARFDLEIITTAGDETRASATIVPFAPRATPPTAAASSSSVWREVAILAAALLIGFFTVSLGLLNGSVLDLAQINQTASISDTDEVSAIALGAEGDDLSEEGLL